jgi:L-asparaginase
MKKILVVFTGGTIGSAVTDGNINTSGDTASKLLTLFNAHDAYPGTVTFDTITPVNILSENLEPVAWQLMIVAIESVDLSQYYGIILTHGTDTLAYTACALSYYFHQLPIPLLLVSSDYPLSNPNGNGLANFICAVDFIRQAIAVGVFVPYRNQGKQMHIHLGSRLTCSVQLTGDFYSIGNRIFLAYHEGEFYSPDSKQKSIQVNATVHDKLRLSPKFSSRILMIKPYPGLDYSHVNLDEVDAVLHDLYHSGTACSTAQWGDRHSLVAFINRCRRENLPVYLAPALNTENAYQSTRELIDNGAIMIWNMSIEAAYVKLTIAYGNYSKEAAILDFIKSDLSGEHVAVSTD